MAHARMILKGAALSITLATGGALAQLRMPAEKFSPRPVQTLPQMTGGGLYPYSGWTKFCGRDKKNPAAPQICLTVMEVKSQASPFAAGAALIEGADKTLFRVTLPGDVKREAGARVAIDDGKPRSGKFVNCNPRGCLADFETSAEFVARLKAGGVLHLGGTRASGRAVSYRLPLEGFAKANDGPPGAAPVRSK